MAEDPTVDVNALAQATDTTFGRSSTTKTATFPIKMRQVGSDRLQADYICSVNFVQQVSLRDMKKKCDDEAKSAIDDALSKVKKEYKDITGKALKVKKLATVDSSIEPVAMNFFNPVRRGYFRYRIVYELG